MKKLMIALFLFILIIAALLLIGNKTISTEIVINAPVDRVWREFSDFDSYPRWNPFIKRITGTVKAGGPIAVTIQPRGGDPMDFNPEVLQLKEKEILQWQGRLLFPGIFTGKHTFRMAGIGATATKFIHSEEFSGILVPFINLEPTREGFMDMNEALKVRAEK